MFAYCGNNPILYRDICGTMFEKTLVVAAVDLLTPVGLVAATLFAVRPLLLPQKFSQQQSYLRN